MKKYVCKKMKLIIRILFEKPKQKKKHIDLLLTNFEKHIKPMTIRLIFNRIFCS